MKKSLYGMVCACCFFMMGAVACDDGGSSKHYCDMNFVNGCQDGVYVQCENIRDGRGEVVEYKHIKRGGLNYFCNTHDELVPEGYTCSQGQLVDSAGMKHRYLCSEASVVSCSGDEVTVHGSVCDEINNKMIWCEVPEDGNEWEVKEESCGDNLCVEFERSGSMHAGCFERTGVQEGCGDIDIKGECSGSTLTFCTHSDSKSGKRVTLDCGKRGICTFIDESWGYDCTEYCGTPEDASSFATYRGSCEGNTLVMCVTDDTSSKITRQDEDCGDDSQCMFDSTQEMFVCK